ncbi:hypothetical protein NLK61_02460 [Pseudomonas fuscovaginae UPB0736]|uniref:hypothetical protein n=1 Tax=Pseudomonas asplenii TaxID=53407 RepID=UPI0002896B68|nr:hypothetical protein [Pseudomonas fuscovaginae]UUQ65537.1 hypothetical protein NLK61_02460 [Pseudomonas fuscovaginae UPB0736]
MVTLLSYEGMRQQIFFFYTGYCRLKIREMKKSGFSWGDGELEVGYALREMRGSFNEPVEELMLYTAVQVLAAGREPEAAYEFVYKNIKEIISVYGLGNLLAQLSEEDSGELRSDLELLGFV